MDERRPRAGIYARLSYAHDGSTETVDRQEADCRELGSRLGWEISEEHVWQDNSRSAWQRSRKRPGWGAMLAALDAGDIDAIIVYHGDRLIRQPHDLETLISITDSKGVRIASVSGTRNLDSADDRFILRIEAAQACRESDNISRRVRRALGDRAGRGLTQVGGRRPFGFGVAVGTRWVTRHGGEVEEPIYDTTQHCEPEARVLIEAAQRLLSGQPQSGVVRWVASTGVTSTEGGPVTSRMLRGVLLAPRVAGLIERDGQLLQAAWEPILEPETWHAVRAVYERSAQSRPYPGRARRYLLSGVATCGVCETGRVATKPSGGRNRKTARIYYCAACKGVGRNQELLDAYVTGKTLALLADERLMDVMATGDGAAGVAAEIATLERRQAAARDQLAHLADLPEIDAGLVARSIASFDRRIAELRQRMAETAEHRLLARVAGITREQWDAEPVDVRSAVVAALWRVTVLPTQRRGPGFDPSGVRLERRTPDGPR